MTSDHAQDNLSRIRAHLQSALELAQQSQETFLWSLIAQAMGIALLRLRQGDPRLSLIRSSAMALPINQRVDLGQLARGDLELMLIESLMLSDALGENDVSVSIDAAIIKLSGSGVPKLN